MSFTITEAFVKQWGSIIFDLAEQQGSRLFRTVAVETGVVGESKSFERLGSATSHALVTRHGDTVYDNIDHSRRWAMLSDTAVALLVDEMDKLKTLIEDPTNKYRVKALNKLGRDIDTAIIKAISGIAKEGKEATTDVALPASQKIAAGGTGFTLAKWRQAKKLLDAAEVPEDGRFLVIDAKAINDDLLSDSTLTSADFNTVKVLANGELKSFLGFEIIRTQLLEKDESGNWLGLAYQRDGVGLAVGASPFASIDVLPTKNYATQVYARMSIGAVRIEDARVVQIAYTA